MSWECIRATLHGALVRGYDATLVCDAHSTEGHARAGLPGHLGAVDRVHQRVLERGGARPHGQRGTYRAGRLPGRLSAVPQGAPGPADTTPAGDPL
jgi:hypothetical protein